VDANGYEMFCCLADGQGEAASLKWVDGLPYDTAASKWVHLVKRQRRNVLFRPPKPSGRFLPLQRID
jgi:hypothetical protein